MFQRAAAVFEVKRAVLGISRDTEGEKEAQEETVTTSRIHNIQVAIMVISQPVTAPGCMWRRNRLSKTSLLVTWTYQDL